MLSPLDMRWRIALMLCVITTINYLDRQALSIAAPSLMKEFSISNTQYGWITSAFLFTYALGQLLSGPIIDRLGTKRGFNLAVVVWSVAGILHVLGRGFMSFFSLRGLLGFGEAANFPAALKAIAEWFPRAERSMAVGILTVGPGLGAVLSPPLAGFHLYPGLAGGIHHTGTTGFSLGVVEAADVPSARSPSEFGLLRIGTDSEWPRRINGRKCSAAPERFSSLP